MARRLLRPGAMRLSMLLVAGLLAAPGVGASPKRVVLIVGQAGAGKSPAAAILGSRTGAPQYSAGDVVRHEVIARGLPRTPDNEHAMREHFARTPGAIGRRLADQVSRGAGPLAIVEGIRSPVDVAAFRSRMPDTTVVALEVGAERRHAHQFVRERPGEDSMGALRARDRAELRLGVRDTMRTATLRLRPRGPGMDSLERSVNRLMLRLDLPATGPSPRLESLSW